MSVMRKDLPPKKEFVITVPLTELQSKAYSIYVRSMLANATRNKKGDIPQTTIWSWLAILSLLCNHPSPFMAKLTDSKAQAKKGGKASTPASRDCTDQEGIATDLNLSAETVGVSEGMVHEEQTLFEEAGADMMSIELSYKTQILCQILDACKAAGDKTLVFSQSIPSLDFLERMCASQGRRFARLDGTTAMSKRQNLTKQFNTGNLELYLISTAAGGLGLNLFGANRVVIFDFRFNPIWEEQAVGRAYRIGQKKDVFVYRFVAGGTFEDSVHNRAVFKKQLASRVVDKKNPVACAKKKSGDFLFEPKDVEQMNLSECRGKDPEVLDKILASQVHNSTIRAIVQTDTFEKDDDDNLTVDEQKQVDEMIKEEKLKRTDPHAYSLMVANRDRPVYRDPEAYSGHASTLGLKRSSLGSYATPRNYPSLQTGQRFLPSAPLIPPSSPIFVASPSVPTPSMARSSMQSATGSPGGSPTMGAGTRVRSSTPPSRATTRTIVPPTAAEPSNKKNGSTDQASSIRDAGAEPSKQARGPKNQAMTTQSRNVDVVVKSSQNTDHPTNRIAIAQPNDDSQRLKHRNFQTRGGVEVDQEKVGEPSSDILPSKQSPLPGNNQIEAELKEPTAASITKNISTEPIDGSGSLDDYSVTSGDYPKVKPKRGFLRANLDSLVNMFPTSFSPPS